MTFNSAHEYVSLQVTLMRLVVRHETFKKLYKEDNSYCVAIMDVESQIEEVKKMMVEILNDCV